MPGLGFLIVGGLLVLLGLALAKRNRQGWSLAALIGGVWMLALWVFAGQGAL